MVSTLLLIGDSRIISRQIPEIASTRSLPSPPYLWQRDYGHADQIGHEITPDEYVQTLVEVFASLKPALRDDGSLWLNLGSTYASKRCGNFKPKDLIPTPWMTALALQNAGWYLRQDLIWHKRLTENELSDFSRLWHDGCVEAIIEAQDVERNHSTQV